MVATPVEEYVYDGDTVLQVTDGAGVTQMEYTSTAQGYGDLLSNYDGTQARYYEPDALGSTDALADQSQNVVDRWRYRAFGSATQTLGSDSTPFTWVGRQGYYSDSQTGLYQLGNGTRYYDPGVAQFLSEDPIGFGGGDPNLRRYAANRPNGNRDPSGLVTCDEFKETLSKAIELFNKCAAARKVSEDVKAVWGRFAPIQCDEKTRTAATNMKTGVIRIAPSAASVEQVVALILIELLNARDKKLFDEIFAECEAGTISRDDFIARTEAIEFFNTQDHHEVVAACLKEEVGWGDKCDRYGPFYGATFTKYLERQKKSGHSGNIGDRWDKLCKPAWDKRRGK